MSQRISNNASGGHASAEASASITQNYYTLPAPPPSFDGISAFCGAGAVMLLLVLGVLWLCGSPTVTCKIYHLQAVDGSGALQVNCAHD